MEDTYFDISRKIQEFGFGPSDSETEDEVDQENLRDWRELLANDWESIGLLPSLQRLQITFRNMTYSFMTGSKSEAINSDSELVASRASSEDLPDHDHTFSHDRPFSHDHMFSTYHNHPEAIHSDLITPESSCSHPLHARCGSASELPVSLADKLFKNPRQVAPSNGQKKIEEEERDDDNLSDDWDRVGILPNLVQIQHSLRNASAVFSSQNHSGTSSKSPIWHNFMPSIALPSFFEDHEIETEKLVDIDDPAYADIFDESTLTEEDRAVYYDDEGITGCKHYLRNCKAECSQCHKFYMCQLCHDEKENHCMNRTLTRRMLCLNCKKPQQPRQSCRFCNQVMSDYYCDICKLWNDDPEKPIYHCDKCGICRVGRGLGIDVFHCDKCGICMNLVVMNNHRCIEQAARSDCPICLEDLFTSTAPTVFMPCGHPIHRECFDEYSKRYYRCPVCAKSVFDTSALFRMIDEEIKLEVLPPELTDKKVLIICQDCHLKSQTNFHLAGLKCDNCSSYNTTQV